jgi:hypothetical protein
MRDDCLAFEMAGTFCHHNDICRVGTGGTHRPADINGYSCILSINKNEPGIISLIEKKSFSGVFSSL